MLPDPVRLTAVPESIYSHSGKGSEQLNTLSTDELTSPPTGLSLPEASGSALRALHICPECHWCAQARTCLLLPGTLDTAHLSCVHGQLWEPWVAPTMKWPQTETDKTNRPRSLIQAPSNDIGGFSESLVSPREDLHTSRDPGSLWVGDSCFSIGFPQPF